MSLKIRLARGGAKKNPHYSIVVIESTKARDGKYIEKIGHYHPVEQSEDKRIIIDAEKLLHWIQNGANPTEVVVKLAKKLNITLPKRFDITFVKSDNYGKKKKERKG